MSKYFLAQSTWIRITAFTLFYLAQGIPIGLMSIAMPAWFASLNFEGAQIAAFVSITGLPWAFKLIAGPFMDRFAFLPMGFRRPWVMAAQGGLTLAILCMAVVTDPAGQFWTMVSIGFAINCFAAIQDVAVDGMAIDVLPESERGRANAFMAFGQVVGFSAFGALCGWLLVNFGLAFTAGICGMAVAAVFLFITLVRERQGERLLPWTLGTPASRLVQPPNTVRSVFADLIKVLVLPMGLILMATEFASRVGAGVTVTIAPLIAVQELGYSTEDYSLWYGLMTGISAVVGLLFGPLVDRYGTKRILMIGFCLGIGSALAFALVQPWWTNGNLVFALFFINQISSQILFVAIIAGFMTICSTRVAATQFAIYMSLSNLGRSAGAALYGLLAVKLSYVEAIYLIAGFNLLALLCLVFFNMDAHKEHLKEVENQVAC